MPFQNRFAAVRSPLERAELPCQAGYVAIAPFHPAALPPDSRALLQGRHMKDTFRARLGRRPALAFLDRTENCDENSRVITRVGNELTSGMDLGSALEINSEKYCFSHTISGPGVYGFYLPEQLAPLKHLARLAATAAALTGKLGKKWIELNFRRQERPHPSADWHRDDTNTFLICASKVSSEFAVVSKPQSKGWLKSKTFMSPLAGMPVAFNNKVKHSRPFQRKGELQAGDSDVFIIWESDNMPVSFMPPVLRPAYETLFPKAG